MPPDMDKFRLRRFVEKLDAMGEVETHDAQTNLSDIAVIIQNSPNVVWFKNVGPEMLELVANVNGSQKRLAVAMGVSEGNILEEFKRRLDNPQPVIEVEHEQAPVQQIVLEKDQADLTKLPFYLQHQFDGSAYISSGIDYSVDPETGTTNVGCRRRRLRNGGEAGTNLTAPSDLKRIYTGCCSRGEKLPINFAVGSHPIDFMAAGMRIPADEITLVSTLRGEPVPLVKGITNNVRVPADAEMVVEGYLDEHGYWEPDGPYGEYVGYYGPMHQDPVFHVTAITMREDVLHQTLLHGAGPKIHRAESVHLLSVRLQAQASDILKSSNINVADVYVPPGSAEGQHLRVSIFQEQPGQAQSAIAALFGSMFSLKHIFIVDDDINIRDEHQWEWAFVSRFQADRDMISYKGMPGMPMDPSVESGPFGTKAGCDFTLPLQRRHELMMTVATAPTIEGPVRYKTVNQALEKDAPLYFSELMTALGSRDGREITVQLDELRAKGRLMRDCDGRYLIGEAPKGKTGLFGPQHKDPNV